MKTLIAVLIICSFLQSTIIPLDLVLIVLICRSFIRSEKSNLYLAFGFGLFLSHLNLTPWGVQSILFLILVVGVEGLSKSRLSQNPLLIIPISFTAIMVYQVALIFITRQSLQLLPEIYGSLLSLPIFYSLKFWEERFIVRKDIRLRI